MKHPYLFSSFVPQYLQPTQRGFFEELRYQLLYRTEEEKIKPLLCISPDDIESVLNSLPEFRTFFVEGVHTDEGVVYVSVRLGGISAEHRRTLTPREIGEHFLVAWRHHWQVTRGVDCYPFIVSLTTKRLLFGQPISIQGMRTLARIQADQQALLKQSLEQQASRQERIAQVTSDFQAR